MLLSKAIDGFIIDGRAGRLSNTTVELYKHVLKIFLLWYGDKELEMVTPEDLSKWMLYLRTEYVPKRFSGDTRKLSPSSIDNYWTGLRSFFRWCEERFGLERPDIHLPRPKYKLTQPIPFSKDEVTKLLDTAKFIKVSANELRSHYKYSTPTSHRNTAVIMVLLDTGMRLGEMCRLKISDVNLDIGEIYIRPFESGMKSKPRTLPLGEVARGDLWRYLSDYDDLRPDDSLFEMSSNAVRLMLKKLGERAGIQKVHAHRFRHTFAIECLRNGVDPFRLQYLLGHSDLTMVQHYLFIVQADLAAAHRRGSPGDKRFRRRRRVG